MDQQTGIKIIETTFDQDWYQLDGRMTPIEIQMTDEAIEHYLNAGNTYKSWKDEQVEVPWERELLREVLSGSVKPPPDYSYLALEFTDYFGDEDWTDDYGY